MTSKKLFVMVSILAAAAMLGPSRSSASPMAEKDVPPDLRPWISWVLDEAPDRNCAITARGETICIWPGELRLNLNAKGGVFTLTAWADREMYLELPGDPDRWPQDVKLDARPAAVMETNGKPSVKLLTGRHQIAGRFVWKELPEGIRIPTEAAIVSLVLDGAVVPFPRRDADGLLWLQSAASTSTEEERLELEVFRKISDGVPMTVTTRIVARASGRSREANLGRVLLQGTMVLSVDADIPARIDKDGNLRIQVAAGTHQIDVIARTDGSPDSFTSAKREPPWPEQEIWSCEADEALRQVQLSGLPGVDASRTNLPDEWRSFPAFLVRPEGKLVLTTVRRGEPEPGPDRISLDREFWLDLDGKGYTVRDSLYGTLSRSWRLDFEEAGLLGRVAVDDVDQLITKNPATGKPGVELRQSAIRLAAESRIERKCDLGAVGWSQKVEQLSANLHLPPGWSLFSASGVDEAPGTWLDRWDLFGLLFALLLAAAIGKLTRWRYGILALATLVATYEEPHAPFIVWVSLVLSLALLKVLHEGRLRTVVRWWWWLSVILLAVGVVNFGVSQLRTGLFPQVTEEMQGIDIPGLIGTAARAPVAMLPQSKMAEAPSGAARAREEEGKATGNLDSLTVVAKGGGGASGERYSIRGPTEKMEMGLRGGKDKEAAAGMANVGQNMAAQAASPPAPTQAMPYEQREISKLGSTSSGKGKLDTWQAALQQDLRAVIQTGFGVPTWSWNTWYLRWKGPVEKDHRIKLCLLCPCVNLMLSILRVVLLLLLAWRFVHLSRNSVSCQAAPGGGAPKAWRGTSPQAGPENAGAAAAGTALLLVILCWPGKAFPADYPDRSLLDDLKSRLTRQDECRPDCVSTSLLDIAVNQNAIRLSAEVHAGATSTVRIPGPARNWIPSSVRVDGQPISALALLGDGFLHVRLAPGRHSIEALGSMPQGDSLVLELGEEPHRVAASVAGWAVDGLREDGKAESSIQFTRLAPENGAKSGATATVEGSYPPWLEITRIIDLGIPWLVQTHVRRVSPVGAPVLERVPLLPGESVTQSDLEVQDNAVVVSLGRDDTEADWSSTLKEAPEIRLTAAKDKPWSEIWIIRPSPIWQLGFQGLPAIGQQADARLEPLFRPWPGETVTLTMKRPQGVEGRSITIDSAALTTAPDKRYLKADLSLAVRSSRGGVQKITLPDKAEVQNLLVNGAKQPFHLKDRTLEINLKTGKQDVLLSWQQPIGLALLARAPAVDLGRDAANIRVSMQMPQDRWILLAGGPCWGPKVLFWGWVLILLASGYALGRVRMSPFTSREWMILGLGLTQIPLVAVFIVAGFFWVLVSRGARPPRTVLRHNLLQVLLAIWSLGALGILIAAVYDGLVSAPDMMISGGGSAGTYLAWYVDRTNGALPTPWAFALPVTAWKVLMLAWALWLALRLRVWGPQLWRHFVAEGLWRKKQPAEK